MIQCDLFWLPHQPNLIYNEQKSMGQKEFRHWLPYGILALNALTL